MSLFQEQFTIVEEIAARTNEPGGVFFLKISSVVTISGSELTLELSGIRDCGGIRERLEVLERNLLASSILARLFGFVGYKLWRWWLAVLEMRRWSASSTEPTIPGFGTPRENTVRIKFSRSCTAFTQRMIESKGRHKTIICPYVTDFSRKRTSSPCFSQRLHTAQFRVAKRSGCFHISTLSLPCLSKKPRYLCFANAHKRGAIGLTALMPV